MTSSLLDTAMVITGATSGRGLAAADGLARFGATVWLAVRNRECGDDLNHFQRAE